jgi:hypothetical protein
MFFLARSMRFVKGKDDVHHRRGGTGWPITARFPKKGLAFTQRPSLPPTTPRTETTARQILCEHTGPELAPVRVARGLSRARSATIPFDNAEKLDYANVEAGHFGPARGDGSEAQSG